MTDNFETTLFINDNLFSAYVEYEFTDDQDETGNFESMDITKIEILLKDRRVDLVSNEYDFILDGDLIDCIESDAYSHMQSTEQYHRECAYECHEAA